MQKLAVIHFNPIERYPPVLNWLNFLAGKEGEGIEVRVFTMRAGVSEPGKRKRFAYLNYLVFYFRTLASLILWRPGTVMYYETLSSFPALLYKRFIKRNSSLFIHYHEYTSKKEYEEGMVMSKWLHKKEKKAYRLADWISHTNTDRAGLFRNDLAGVVLPAVHALPNYPPASWQAVNKERPVPVIPVKIVYVGALSLDTMYTKEFAEWVESQSGKVIWDIYTDNVTAEARDYLASFGGGAIGFKEGVNYYDLPGVLAGYDIGVILYKGHIPNYVYNAPNKLFEYMDCGLDVWFPEVMSGIAPYITKGTYPKVLALDFRKLREWPLSPAIDRSGLQYAPRGFYAEQVFPELLKNIRARAMGRETKK